MSSYSIKDLLKLIYDDEIDLDFSTRREVVKKISYTIEKSHKNNFLDLTCKEKFDLMRFLIDFSTYFEEECETLLEFLFELLNNENYSDFNEEDKRFYVHYLLTKHSFYLNNKYKTQSIQCAINLLNSIIQPQDYVLK